MSLPTVTLGDPAILDDPFRHGACPVCGSAYLTFLRNVGTARTLREVPLWVCLHCRSFTCAAGYKEDDATYQSEVEYHLKYVREKERQFADLVEHLREAWGKPKPTLADVGCALGVLVNQAYWQTVDAYGYDRNPHDIAKAKELYPDIRERFHCETFPPAGRTFDIITLIDVMEHVAEPRPFMQSMVSGLNPGGMLYVTVPRLDEDKWEWLRQPVSEQKAKVAPESPFGDCDVHVTHYSTDGLVWLATWAGLTYIRDLNGNPWPQNGVLFGKL